MEAPVSRACPENRFFSIRWAGGQECHAWRWPTGPAAEQGSSGLLPLSSSSLPMRQRKRLPFKLNKLNETKPSNLLFHPQRAKMCSNIIQMMPVTLDHEGNLHFEEQVLQTDSWYKSGKCESAQIFRSPHNHVLIAQPADEDFPAVFERRTDQEIRNVQEVRFDIHSYQDSKPKGLSVAFTVEFNQKTYYMFVEKKENKMRVNFKAGTIPKHIEGDTSNIIFIKTQFSSGSRQFYKFESALERGYFLAFENVKGSTRIILVIKKVELSDEVDESTRLHHHHAPLH